MPKIPKELLRGSYKYGENYDKAKLDYDKNLRKYEREIINYRISNRLSSNTTFHHLFVVYKEGSRKLD